MQYMSQRIRLKDPKSKALVLNVVAGGLGHMEMAAQSMNLFHGHDIVLKYILPPSLP